MFLFPINRISIRNFVSLINREINIHQLVCPLNKIFSIEKLSVVVKFIYDKNFIRWCMEWFEKKKKKMMKKDGDNQTTIAQNMPNFVCRQW